MSMTSSVVLALFLAGLAWFALALRRVSRTLAETTLPGGRHMDLAAIARFARSAHEEIGAYLAAHYSGNVESLPGVMAGLVDRMQARAQSEGLPFDRRLVMDLIETSAVQHRVARPQEIRAALAQLS